MVEVETWYESEGSIWTRRDWILKDYATGEVIGRATRCIPVSQSSLVYDNMKLEIYVPLPLPATKQASWLNQLRSATCVGPHMLFEKLFVRYSTITKYKVSLLENPGMLIADLFRSFI